MYTNSQIHICMHRYIQICTRTHAYIFEYALRYYIPQDQSNLSLDEGIQTSRVIAAKVHELGVLPLILLCASPIFIVQQPAATALGNLAQV